MPKPKKTRAQKREGKTLSTAKLDDYLRNVQGRLRRDVIEYLRDAIFAVENDHDTEDVMRSIQNALLCMGEARGIGNAAYDVTQGEIA